jgi:hypothetical protein
VRYELVRAEVPADTSRCRYRTTIATHDATYHGHAELGADGAATLAPEGAPPPEDLRAQLAMFAQLLARGAWARAGEGLAAWPDRVQRWRPRKGAG